MEYLISWLVIVVCVLGIAGFSFQAGVDEGKRSTDSIDKQKWIDEGRMQILQENLIRSEALHRSISVDMERALTQMGKEVAA